MSTVPYTFATDTGNIPLSQLDANFANVKAFANTAGYVTGADQANITSVGTLVSVSVTGNITSGNVRTAGLISSTGTVTGSSLLGSVISVTGNITAGNIAIAAASTAGSYSATGNITGSSHLGLAVSVTGNITAGNIFNNGLSSVTGNITGGNILTTGNITVGNILNTGLSSVTGNITAGNVITTGISSRYIDVSIPVYANITATGTYSLSTINSINILTANNAGYTATLNMPAGPRDGQICNFAIYGATVTLAVGTGTVLPTFAGSTLAGTGYRYVYRTINTSWYRIG
jgi:hypothetical protein